MDGLKNTMSWRLGWAEDGQRLHGLKMDVSNSSQIVNKYCPNSSQIIIKKCQIVSDGDVKLLSNSVR